MPFRLMAMLNYYRHGMSALKITGRVFRPVVTGKPREAVQAVIQGVSSAPASSPVFLASTKR